MTSAPNRPRPSDRPPIVDASIVVPTKDRPDALAACLDAIAALRLDGLSVEVVVVDDGSRRPVDPVVAPFESRLDLKLLVQRNRGPAAARNAGAAVARGRLLAFTDDDCRPEPAWITSLVARSDQGHELAVGGRTVNALARDLFATASQDLVDYLYLAFGADDARPQFFTTNNLLVPARPFRAVGGFDPSFPRAAAEDRDFCDRWRASGREMAFAPEAVVSHHHHQGPARFWRLHHRYGRGAARFHLRRRERTGARCRPEPIGFYLGLIGYGLRRGRGWRAPALAALLAVSQVANATGFLVERAAGLLGGRQQRPGRGTMLDHGGPGDPTDVDE